MKTRIRVDKEAVEHGVCTSYWPEYKGWFFWQSIDRYKSDNLYCSSFEEAPAMYYSLSKAKQCVDEFIADEILKSKPIITEYIKYP